MHGEERRLERIVFDRYEYVGFHGCRSFCKLEILPLPSGRTVVIATELPDNPGTSVTNACEILASSVCVGFGIDPSTLVWLEHYGYASSSPSGNPRRFDLVSLELLPVGHDGLFTNPSWRPMQDADWIELGLEPRAPAHYPPRHG